LGNLELAGCDLLTISPALLEELQKTSGPVPCKLDPAKAGLMPIPKQASTRNVPLAAQRRPDGDGKTLEGIRVFAADTIKLERFIAEKLKLRGWDRPGVSAK
jgi:transaldolase